MEPDEIANPVPVGLLSSWAVMAHSNGFAKLITESWAPVTIRVHGYSPFFCPYDQCCGNCEMKKSSER